MVKRNRRSREYWLSNRTILLRNRSTRSSNSIQKLIADRRREIQSFLYGRGYRPFNKTTPRRRRPSPLHGLRPAKIVEAQPDYGPALCVLGLIDAGLGRKDEALKEGRRAVEVLPVEKDAINGPLMNVYLAMIAAWVGEKDVACEQLATVAQPPSSVSHGQLKLLPFWDPLRGDPRFEKIVASLAP